MSKKNGYIILTNTICQGTVVGCRDENDSPVVFETSEDAWKEIADDMITRLQQFIDGERSLVETPFQAEEWAEEVEIIDGIYYTASGPVWPEKD